MFEIGKKGRARKGLRGCGAVRHAAGLAPAQRRQSGPREKAVIGPSIHIDGDLRGEEDLLIEGEVNGTVQLRNNSLTIGAQGKVRADVYAHSIYVEGLMEGDLYGTERVHIRKSAQVRGNVTSPRVSLEDGAQVQRVDRDGPASRPDRPRPSRSMRQRAPGGGLRSLWFAGKPETAPGAQDRSLSPVRFAVRSSMVADAAPPSAEH